MHVGARGLRKTLEKILEQLDLEIADVLRGDFCAHYTTRPAAQVHGSRGKSFVHWHQEIARAQDAALRAKGPLQRFTERDAGVFNGVVLVHVQVAAGDQFKIESTVAGKKLQHVVEEADARGDTRFAAAVEIQPDANIRLVRLAMNVRDA